MKKYNLDIKDIKELGNILKKNRTNQNKSVIELSKTLGINAGYISKLENGHNTKSINILLLKAISKTLGLDYIDLLKKIGYIDKDSLILNIENINKMNQLFNRLKNELGFENDLFKDFTIFFLGSFKKCYEDNITIYENEDEIEIDKNISEFIVKSMKFKGRDVKAFLKKVDNIENGKYILINYKGDILWKKFYKEDPNLILISFDEKVEPLVLKEKEVSILGVLWKTVEEKRY